MGTFVILFLFQEGQTLQGLAADYFAAALRIGEARSKEVANHCGINARRQLSLAASLS